MNINCTLIFIFEALYNDADIIDCIIDVDNFVRKSTTDRLKIQTQFRTDNCTLVQ